MQLVRNILSVAGIALLVASCDNVDFQKTKGGMPYKLYASKSGKKVENGKFVKMQVKQMIKDSVLFNTYNSLPVYFQINDASQQPYDPSEIFTTLKEGDSIYTVQMMDTFIKRNPAIVQQTKFKNGDKITTTFKILKVFNTADEYRQDEEKEKMEIVKREEAVVKEYLSKKGIKAQRSEHGAYTEILNEGVGPKADSGKYVSAMYKGQTFAGKVFDTNMDSSFKHTDPLTFTVGSGQMIRGLDEGIRFLGKGGKARVYIPSSLAYGGQSPSPDIKPFENLIFDIEILDVQDKAPAQPAMPPVVDPTQQR